MLKVLGEWLQPKPAEAPEKPPVLARGEIEHLFRDDLVAHSVTLKPREPARRVAKAKNAG
ncbi:MAG: hypothetical protein RIR62_2106 [Pseudomonadota bacterium]